METMLAASNPKIDTTPLPDDQPVSLLEEAQDYYRGAEPPFVTRNTGKNANGNIKRVALATTDGKYPQLPVTVNCTHRLWSKGFTYSTVDLNGKRRIVKSRSGGPNGGASYILWRGVEKGFAERPVGFSEKDLSLRQSTSTPTPTDYSDEPGSPPRKKIFRASKPIVARAYHDDSITSSPYEGTPDLGSEQPHLTIQSSSSPSSSANEDGDDSDNAMRTDGRSTTISSNWSFSKPSEHTKSGSFMPATPVSPTRISSQRPRKLSTAKNTKANEMLLDMMKRGYTIHDVREEWNRTTGHETSDSAWRSRYWRLNAKGLTGGMQPFSHPNREVRTTEDEAGIYDPVRTMRFCAVNSRHPPGTTSYYKQASSTPAPLPKPSPQDPARQASELSTREAIESPSLANAEAGAQSSSTIYSHLMTPIATPVAASSAMDISSAPFTLAPNKLGHTTLRIADSNTYTPLKLRSCADISALFAKVLDICGLTDRKDAVEALKITFEWVPAADEERNMLLKERYEDSFEFFLEMIDEAPCWAEGRKCTVGVEVVLKEKEKEERMELPGRKSSKTTKDGSSRKPSSSAEQMDYQTDSTGGQDHHEASSEPIAGVPLLEMET